MLSIIVFAVLLFFTFGFFSWNIYKVRSNISMGKSTDRSDRKGERIKTMLLVAFGQKKMFQNLLPAVLHFFIYAAFVITSTELLEIIIDRSLYESLEFFKVALVIDITSSKQAYESCLSHLPSYCRNKHRSQDPTHPE